MQLQVFPLVGLPQFNGWSQVVVEHEHRLICALAVEGQNAGNIGRDLVLHIESSILSSGAEFYYLLQDLVKTTQELEVKVFISAAFIEETQATFAAYNGSVMLKRETKVGNVLSSQNNLKIIQGSIEIHDLLVLATNSAQSYFGEIHQKAGQGYEAEIIMNSMVSAIHEDAASASMSLAFLAVPEPELGRQDPTSAMKNISADFDSGEFPSMSRDASVFDPPVRPTTQDREQTDAPQMTYTNMPPHTDTQTLAMVPTTKKAYTPWRQRVRQGQLLVWKALRHTKPVLRQVGHLTRTVFVKLKNLSSQVKKKSFLTSEVYIDRSSPVPWRVGLVVALIGLLVIGLLLFWRSRQTQQLQAAQVALEPLMTRFAQAEAQVTSDPVTARGEMQSVLIEAETIRANFQDQRRVQEVIAERLAEFQTRYDALSGKAEFSQLPVFYDLTTVQGDFVASQVVSDGSTVVFIDSDTKRAIALDLSTLQPKQFLVSQVSRIVDSAVQNNQVLILGGGVSSFDLAQENPARNEVIAEGDSNREAQLVSTFTDYVYVFNPSKRNLYRYLRGEAGVSDPVGWLKPGQDVPFDAIESLRVDGDVWLGTRTGEVIKLSLGERADFVVTGLGEPFTGPLLIDTQPDWQNLYILEPSARRLVVLNKNGSFLKEIKSASLASVTQLIADEGRNRVLAVSGSVVFELKL